MPETPHGPRRYKEGLGVCLRNLLRYARYYFSPPQGALLSYVLGTVIVVITVNSVAGLLGR